MLLTTGIVALSRKVADERTKRREARQGHLEVGDGDVAKNAFTTQVACRGTEIKYEDPSDVAAEPSSSAASSDSTSTTLKPKLLDSSQPSQPDIRGPSGSEKGPWSPDSPYDESQVSSVDLTQPPPYSPESQLTSATTLSSTYSRDTDGNTLSPSDTKSVSATSTNSNGTHALRIKTVGADLQSSFPYHPALFELRVHPEKWTSFTSQIIESIKLSMNDHAKIWAAATATALTGAIGTSIMLGRGLNRAAQEEKVKSGLANTNDGGLGDTLRAWNETYFNERGLFVHLELSESAMKNPGQKSKYFRKGALLYSKREDRERKREERKFVIVVTRLDEGGLPAEALEELKVSEESASPDVPEIGSSDEPWACASELPGEKDPVELPGEEDAKLTEGKTTGPASGYVEMDSDNTLLLEKLQMEQHSYNQPSELEGGLAEESVSVSRRSPNG